MNTKFLVAFVCCLLLSIVHGHATDIALIKNFPVLSIPSYGFEKIEATPFSDYCKVSLRNKISPAAVWELLNRDKNYGFTLSKDPQGSGEVWLRFVVNNPGTKAAELFCEIPALQQVWAVSHFQKTPHFNNFQVKPSSSPLWMPSFNSGFYLNLHPGQQLVFLVRCFRRSYENKIKPIIWELDVYNQHSYAKATQYILVKSLIIGAFAVIFCFSIILFYFFRRAVYGWYAAFQFSLLAYLWRDFAWRSPISDFALSDEAWYSGKIIVAVLIICCYLKFIQKFLDEQGNLYWLNKAIRLFIPILIAYSIIHWGVQKTGWAGPTMKTLFYFRLAMVLPSAWLIYKIWQIQGIAANYARWAIMVVMPTIATTLVLTFTLNERYNWFGLEYTLLPLYLGLLGESSIFLLAVSQQESIWLRERTQALNRANERQKKQLEHEQELIQKKEKDLLQIRQELAKIYQHRAEISQQKFEQEKMESELLKENAALRSRFTPDLLLRIQSRILNNIRNLEKEVAMEKLRSFAVMMRDSLYFLRQKEISLAAECKLCAQLCALFESPISIPSFSSNVKEIPIPPLFMLNIVQQAIMNQASDFQLQLHEKDNGCQVIIENLNIDDAFLKNCQQQIINFNEHHLLNHRIERLEKESIVIDFQAPIIG